MSKIAPVPPVETIPGRGRKRTFTKEQVWRLRSEFNDNPEADLKFLAQKYGTSAVSISNALRGVGAYEGI